MTAIKRPEFLDDGRFTLLGYRLTWRDPSTNENYEKLYAIDDIQKLCKGIRWLVGHGATDVRDIAVMGTEADTPIKTGESRNWQAQTCVHQGYVK